MNIIDCRYRPATAPWLETFVGNPVYAEYVRLTGLDKTPVTSLEACAARLRALGIGRAIVTGRDVESSFGAPPSNALADAAAAAFPGLFVAVHGYDPRKGMAAYRAMRAALADGRSAGASIEPAMASVPADDALWYPLYALCCDHDAPVLITAGLSPHMPHVYLDMTAPGRLDRVATDFPELRLLISHGGYPWVSETIAVCLRHENVFLDFSSTSGKPLAELYAAAAAGPLAGLCVFASGSPFTDVETALKRVLDLPLDEEARAALLHGAATRLFRNLR